MTNAIQILAPGGSVVGTIFPKFVNKTAFCRVVGAGSGPVVRSKVTGFLDGRPQAWKKVVGKFFKFMGGGWNCAPIGDGYQQTNSLLAKFWPSFYCHFYFFFTKGLWCTAQIAPNFFSGRTWKESVGYGQPLDAIEKQCAECGEEFNPKFPFGKLFWSFSTAFQKVTKYMLFFRCCLVHFFSSLKSWATESYLRPEAKHMRKLWASWILISRDAIQNK